jgi:hypothetical protein
MARKCPHCEGTGIEKVIPYPFEEWPQDDDMLIRVSKSMINLFYRWKNDIVDASGNKYEARKHIDQIANAVTRLEIKKVITNDQKSAIITYLMNDKDG